MPATFWMKSSAPASRDIVSYTSPSIAVNTTRAAFVPEARSLQISSSPIPAEVESLLFYRKLNSTRMASYGDCCASCRAFSRELAVWTWSPHCCRTRLISEQISDSLSTNSIEIILHRKQTAGQQRGPHGWLGSRCRSKEERLTAWL